MLLCFHPCWAQALFCPGPPTMSAACALPVDPQPGEGPLLPARTASFQEEDRKAEGWGRGPQDRERPTLMGHHSKETRGPVASSAAHAHHPCLRPGLSRASRDKRTS